MSQTGGRVTLLLDRLSVEAGVGIRSSLAAGGLTVSRFENATSRSTGSLLSRSGRVPVWCP